MILTDTFTRKFKVGGVNVYDDQKLLSNESDAWRLLNLCERLCEESHWGRVRWIATQESAIEYCLFSQKFVRQRGYPEAVERYTTEGLTDGDYIVLIVTTNQTIRTPIRFRKPSNPTLF